MQQGGRADFLRPVIWSHVSGLMRFRPGFWQLIRSISISTPARSCVRSPLTMQPSCPGLSLVRRAGFKVMTLRQSNSPLNGKVQTHWDRKRWDRWRAKSWACSSFSLTSRGLFTKNSSRQAKQSVLHTTVTFYGNCMKMRKGSAPNSGDNCCITTMHRLTLPCSPRNCWTKTTWLSSPAHATHLIWLPVTFLCFPNWR
jgi:hypothetical protein